MNLEELNELLDLNEKFDPRCPKCGKVHPRKKTYSFWVASMDKYREGAEIKDLKDNKSCDYAGAITIEDLRRGMKRPQEE